MNGAPLPTTIAGVPNAASDTAVARFLERFLAEEHPGTRWQAAPTERRAA